RTGAGGRRRRQGRPPPGQVGRDLLRRVAAVVVVQLGLRQRASGDLGAQVARAGGVDREGAAEDVVGDLGPVVAAEVALDHPAVDREPDEQSPAAVVDAGAGAAAARPGQDRVAVVAGPVADLLRGGAPAATDRAAVL